MSPVPQSRDFTYTFVTYYTLVFSHFLVGMPENCRPYSTLKCNEREFTPVDPRTLGRRLVLVLARSFNSGVSLLTWAPNSDLKGNHDTIS